MEKYKHKHLQVVKDYVTDYINNWQHFAAIHLVLNVRESCYLYHAYDIWLSISSLQSIDVQVSKFHESTWLIKLDRVLIILFLLGHFQMPWS